MSRKENKDNQVKQDNNYVIPKNASPLPDIENEDMDKTSTFKRNSFGSLKDLLSSVTLKSDNSEKTPKEETKYGDKFFKNSDIFDISIKDDDYDEIDTFQEYIPIEDKIKRERAKRYKEMHRIRKMKLKEERLIHHEKYYSIFLIAASLMVLLIFIASLVARKEGYSWVENRNLMKSPHFTSESFLSGNYQNNLEEYYKDHLPFRENAIIAKAYFEKFFFKQEINDAYVAEEKFLMAKFRENTPEVTMDKVKAINEFYEANSALNFEIMMVPNKIEIYGNYMLPFTMEKSQAKYLNNFYSSLNENIKKINLIPYFIGNRTIDLFFKSDHHWTQHGAFLAANVRNALNDMKQMDPKDYNVVLVNNDFYGTLSSKTGIFHPVDKFEIYVEKNLEDVIVSIPSQDKKMSSVYDLNRLLEKDKYLTFLGGNYDMARVQTTSKSGKNLLLIKDSYANAIVPFLTKEFSSITLVDLRYFKDDISDIIKDYEITDVLILYSINNFNDDNSILNLME